MSANRDERSEPLPDASEADVLEQQQEENEVGPAETVSAGLTEGSAADLAEQGLLRPDPQPPPLSPMPVEANPPDVLEQHQEIPVPDEDRRD